MKDLRKNFDLKKVKWIYDTEKSDATPTSIGILF